MGSSGPPFQPRSMFELGRMARQNGASFHENPVLRHQAYGGDFEGWVGR